MITSSKTSIAEMFRSVRRRVTDGPGSLVQGSRVEGAPAAEPETVPTSRPKISVIVIAYDMKRQAMNTLRSLAPDYQQGVSAEDYEVIVVENRSRSNLDPEEVDRLPGNFRYFLRDEPGVSPAPAINFGISQARGDAIGLMIDGARLLSPGVMRYALMAYRMLPHPVVAVPGYQLGPRSQYMDHSHTEETDRMLLSRIHWPKAGYRLFEISSMSLANRSGVFRPFMECNCLFVPTSILRDIGGADERFSLPGGGALNLFIYHRAVNHPATELVVLPGEGSFHQVHGGVTTSSRPEREKLLETIKDQLTELLGEPFKAPEATPVLLGHLPLEGFPFLEYSSDQFVRRAARLTRTNREAAATSPEPPVPRKGAETSAKVP